MERKIKITAHRDWNKKSLASFAGRRIIFALHCSRGQKGEERRYGNFAAGGAEGNGGERGGRTRRTLKGTAFPYPCAQ